MRYKDFSEAELRHLEMIISVINRLSIQGIAFQLLAILGTLITLSASLALSNPWVGLVAVVATGSLWRLDARAQRSEEQYRNLYYEGTCGGLGRSPFVMDPFEYVAPSRRGLWRWAITPDLMWLYGSLGTASVCVAAAIILA